MDLASHVNSLKETLAMRAQAAMEEVREHGGGEHEDFMGLLSNLFADMDRLTQENEELLQTLSREDGMRYAMKQLQQECGIQGAFILNAYVNRRDLRSLKQRVVCLGYAESEQPDPQMFDPCLQEVHAMIRTSEDYLYYFTAKARKLDPTERYLSTTAAPGFRAGRFGEALKNLTTFYASLEGLLIKENARRAIQMDEPLRDAMTTSMVDDVFFILRTCAQRAISTFSVEAVLATTNRILDTLNNEYKEALIKLSGDPDSALFTTESCLSEAGAKMATALNDEDASAERILWLSDEMEDGCLKMFSASPSIDEVKCRLAELGRTSEHFRQLVNAGLEKFAGAIAPRLQRHFDGTRVPSEADALMNSDWMKELFDLVGKNVTRLHLKLTANNYESLVPLIVNSLVIKKPQDKGEPESRRAGEPESRNLRVQIVNRPSRLLV